MGLNAIYNFFLNIPIDWIIIVVAVVLVALDTVRAGSGRAFAIALSLPATLFLTSQFSQARFLSGAAEQLSTPFLKAVFFGIVFVITYTLVRRIIVSHRTNSGEIIQALIIGVATTAIALVVWLVVPELQSIWTFDPQVRSVFGEQYRFWWIFGSLMALAFVEG